MRSYSVTCRSFAVSVVAGNIDGPASIATGGASVVAGAVAIIAVAAAATALLLDRYVVCWCGVDCVGTDSFAGQHSCVRLWLCTQRMQGKLARAPMYNDGSLNIR